ncbi:MAG: PKD domain-containing protein [Bacteroidetes bacterium]|nr:PKD domain-containing protein [Bacteroidota bacterium]
MRPFLLILFLLATICHSPGQASMNTDNTTSCHAGFSANPEPLQPMVIHFQDQSTGQITLWQWSFGDGSSTTVQNPVHTYATAGTYFVCLTVSNSDSGNICHDFMCISLTIHEPGTCVADYHYTSDPLDRLRIQFFDESTGNINRWHWDFGDGNSSDDRNPSHLFPAYGKFRVCLTAYNIDSLSVCNDIKCDSVELIQPAPCHALFTSELDSLNPVPNTFSFTNNSTGGPNRYLWKFDDGSSSSTRDAKHHFQSSGQHEVCLVIKREEHGSIECADSVCQTISTSRYFDIGGHLFVGDFPINNPVSTGDTGVAYLFRIDKSRLIPYDTCRFTQLGYFTFPGTLNGSYIIRASLTPGSMHYSKYFPAYYRQGLLWKETEILDLTQGDAYVSDIHLTRANDSLTGQGVIRGDVVKANSKSLFEVLPFAEVILYNAQLNPVLFATSDKSGQFVFAGIPFGAYHVYVEYPGKYSRLTAIWLDPAIPVADSLRLEVFNHDVTGFQEMSPAPFVTGELFPNPATNTVNLPVELAKATSIRFEVRTLTGQTAWSGSSSCCAGSNLITIPVRSIRAGLYLLLISTMDGSPVTVKKLLKY